MIQVTRMSDIPTGSSDDPGQHAPRALPCDIALDAPVDSDAAAVQAETSLRELDPSDPAFHWHSIARARGWAQPTLDGSNGGEDPAAWLWRHQQLQEAPGRPAATQQGRDGRRR